MLALAIGGCTIAELRQRMTRREFLSWMEFHRLFPFDDHHRFHRPAVLIAQTLGGGDQQKKLDWLQPDPRNDGLSDADMNTLKAFGYKARAR